MSQIKISFGWESQSIPILIFHTSVLLHFSCKAVCVKTVCGAKQWNRLEVISYWTCFSLHSSC